MTAQTAQTTPGEREDFGHAEHAACGCEPVGQKQIADRLGVSAKTPNTWYVRGLLPKPWGRVGNGPAWCWPHQIVPWAKQTRPSRWDRSGARA